MANEGCCFFFFFSSGWDLFGRAETSSHLCEQATTYREGLGGGGEGRQHWWASWGIRLFVDPINIVQTTLDGDG